MPTSVGPNTYGEENLVFGYDLGDVTNSYKGEPAFNRATALGNWSVFRSSITATTEVEPPIKGAPVYILERTATTSGVLVRDADDSFGYTNNPDLATVGDGTWKYSIWVKGHPATNTNTAFQIDVGDLNNQSLTVNPSTEWTKLETDDSAGLAAGAYKFFDFSIDGALNNKVYVSAVMITTGNQSHPQWLPEKSTRSATQGLIDLTGNSTIDLTNVSFDSNAQMTFDGTNDNLTIGDNSIFDTNNFTAEAVCKLDSFDNSHRTVMAHNAAVYSHTNGWWIGTLRNGLGNGNNDFRMFVWGDSSYVTHSNVIGGSDGNYHHLVLTCTGTTVTFYIDGEQVYTVAKPTGNTYTSGQDVFVGKSPSGDYWSGEIPFSKIYNRALTASEVRSNFNAIKGRFNI